MKLASLRRFRMITIDDLSTSRAYHYRWIPIINNANKTVSKTMTAAYVKNTNHPFREKENWVDVPGEGDLKITYISYGNILVPVGMYAVYRIVGIKAHYVINNYDMEWIINDGSGTDWRKGLESSPLSCSWDIYKFLIIKGITADVLKRLEEWAIYKNPDGKLKILSKERLEKYNQELKDMKDGKVIMHYHDGMRPDTLCLTHSVQEYVNHFNDQKNHIPITEASLSEWFKSVSGMYKNITPERL